MSIGAPLGRRLGLTRIGIHHERLSPGRRTSFPPRRERGGGVRLVWRGRRTSGSTGCCTGWGPERSVGLPAGTGLAHTFLNNTEREVRLLVVGEASKAENRVVYPLHPERQGMREDWWDDAPRAAWAGMTGCRTSCAPPRRGRAEPGGATGPPARASLGGDRHLLQRRAGARGGPASPSGRPARTAGRAAAQSDRISSARRLPVSRAWRSTRVAQLAPPSAGTVTGQVTSVSMFISAPARSRRGPRHRPCPRSCRRRSWRRSGPRITATPPVMYSQPFEPQPSTTTVAPELRTRTARPPGRRRTATPSVAP